MSEGILKDEEMERIRTRRTKISCRRRTMRRKRGR